jgi:hypothetical protein
VTRARGNALQNALAAYLRQWWPHAESAGAGRQGNDVPGTPGVVWECKTAADFKRDFRPAAWVKQADGHAITIVNPDGDEITEVPIVVYFPPGIGAQRTGDAMAIVPLRVMMHVLTEAGYTPAQKEAQI